MKSLIDFSQIICMIFFIKSKSDFKWDSSHISWETSYLLQDEKVFPAYERSFERFWEMLSQHPRVIFSASKRKILSFQAKLSYFSEGGLKAFGRSFLGLQEKLFKLLGETFVLGKAVSAFRSSFLSFWESWKLFTYLLENSP